MESSTNGAGYLTNLSSDFDRLALAQSVGDGHFADSIMGSINQNDDRKLFVGSLAWETQEDEFRDYFAQFGAIKEYTIKKDEIGRSKGFGFILFEEAASANAPFSQVRHPTYINCCCYGSLLFCRVLSDDSFHFIFGSTFFVVHDSSGDLSIDNILKQKLSTRSESLKKFILVGKYSARIVKNDQ